MLVIIVIRAYHLIRKHADRSHKHARKPLLLHLRSTWCHRQRQQARSHPSGYSESITTCCFDAVRATTPPPQTAFHCDGDEEDIIANYTDGRENDEPIKQVKIAELSDQFKEEDNVPLDVSDEELSKFMVEMVNVEKWSVATVCHAGGRKFAFVLCVVVSCRCIVY